jgi:hypothetical protein
MSAQYLPNVCPMFSPMSAQVLPNVCPMSAQCPKIMPNVVRGQISDFFRYVSHCTRSYSVLSVISCDHRTNFFLS